MVAWNELGRRTFNGLVVGGTALAFIGAVLLAGYNGALDQYPTSFAGAWLGLCTGCWGLVVFRHWREAQDPKGRPLPAVFVVVFGIYYVLCAILAFGIFVSLALQDALATGAWGLAILAFIIALLVVWCRKESAKQQLADDFLSDADEATLCSSVPVNIALVAGCAVLLFFQMTIAAQAFGSTTDWLSISPPGSRHAVPDNSTGELAPMHIACMVPDFGGDTELPTVVFEPNVNELGASWTLVQPLVATLTRACYYDRKGYGFSPRGARPRRAGGMARELHDLLVAEFAGPQALTGLPPLVLVAHGFGSVIAHRFTHTYGFGSLASRVHGLVYVDGVHGAQHTIVLDSDVSLGALDDAAQQLGAGNGPTPYDHWNRFAIPLGFIRMSEQASVETGGLGFPFDLLRRLPPARFNEYRASLLGYYHANVVVQEKRDWTTGSMDDVAALFRAGELGSLPLAVVTKDRAHFDANPEYADVQRALAALASAPAAAASDPDLAATLKPTLRHANASSYVLFNDPATIVDAVVDTVVRAYWQYSLGDQLGRRRRRRRRRSEPAAAATFDDVREQLRARMRANLPRMRDHYRGTHHGEALEHALASGAAPRWLY